MERLNDYLGDIDHLVTESAADDTKSYVHPALRRLGCVSVVVLREAIAPAVFRNAEQEITDIDFADELWVRAVPNKFKYGERGRGLQVLRALGVGGRLPQNKTILRKSQQPSDAFDLNTLVFGDSTTHGNRVLPVKAAVSYSDALSLLPIEQCIGETFHNRAAEDGSLFDATIKKNSDNLFSRHFVRPGTLLVQVLSTRGRTLPLIGLKHLLLCMGLAGSYGGQTSITGTNVRTHIVGVYADRFEQAITSPYELVRQALALDETARSEPTRVIAHLHARLAATHALAIPAVDACDWLTRLIEEFNTDGALAAEYRAAAPKVGALFDAWFGRG